MSRAAIVAYLAALAVAIAFLRAPTFSDRLCDPDQGEAAYGARMANDGRCAYDDAVLTKPPGTVFLYAALFRVGGARALPIHLFAALLAWATAALLFVVGRRAGGDAAGLAASALYALYQADAMSSGVCANFEYWTVPAAVAALALIAPPFDGWWNNRAALRWGLAGAAACLAVFMKQTAALHAVATLAALAVVEFTDEDAGGAARVVRSAAWFGVGAAAVVALFAAALASVDCVGGALRELDPRLLASYRQSVSGPLRAEFLSRQMGAFAASNAGLILTVVAALTLFFASPIPRRVGRVAAPVALFAVASCASVFAGGRFFGHYFVVLFPFAALLVALGIGAASRRSPRFGRAALACALALALWDARGEMRLASHAVAGLWRSGDPLTREVFADNARGAYTGNGMPMDAIGNLEAQLTYEKLADEWSRTFAPRDTIWTWDYAPELYLYAGRYAPTRYNENFDVAVRSDNPWYGLWHHEVDGLVVRHRQRLMAELAANPPRVVTRVGVGCDPPGSWARMDRRDMRNAFGDAMVYNPSCVYDFDELRAFLDARYTVREPQPGEWLAVYDLKGAPIDAE